MRNNKTNDITTWRLERKENTQRVNKMILILYNVLLQLGTENTKHFHRKKKQRFSWNLRMQIERRNHAIVFSGVTLKWKENGRKRYLQLALTRMRKNICF